MSRSVLHTNMTPKTPVLSRSDVRQIEHLLQLFGCNQREASIYLQALILGPTTVQALSKSLKQNRITVHSATEQLIEKGFCYETRKGKRRLLVAEDPNVLHRLLQKKENELTVLKENVNHFSTLISSLQTLSLGVPVVKFYEGKDGFRNMLEETLTATSEVLVFTDVDLFARAISAEYLENYFVRRAAKNIHTRLIYPPSKFGDSIVKRSAQYKIQIRVLKSISPWRAGIFSWNNSLGIQSLTEGKLTCTIMENKDIAYFWREVIFPMMWNNTIPLRS